MSHKITAFHPIKMIWLDLDYPSIKQAKQDNPSLTDWRYKNE